MIEELSKNPSLKGVELGEPQPWDSMADAADSVVGFQEIQAGLHLLTVVLQTGTAFFGFVAAVIEVRNKLEKDETIKISDTNSGKTLLTVTSETTDEQIHNAVSEKRPTL